MNKYDLVKSAAIQGELRCAQPLLLTIMVQKYEKFRDEGERKTGFYEVMYDALIRSHDEDKESFDRFFHSVRTPN